MAEPIPFGEVRLDVRAVLAAFVTAEVDIVLVGGVAALLAGSPLTTEDIDLTPSDDPDNLDRAAAALQALGAQWRVPGLQEGLPPPTPLSGADLIGKLSASFVTRHGFVDLVLRHSDGASYDALLAGASRLEVWGLPLTVAGLDDLISAKEAAGRAKDQRTLPILYWLRRRSDPGRQPAG